MRHLDLTIDFETCSLSSNAAVMQLACVPFDRNAEKEGDVFPKDVMPFEAKVDLRSCVMDGFDFDSKTVEWWSRQPEKVKAEVAGGDCYPLKEVMEQFVNWINDCYALYGKELVITLWAQGSDFDIALLRNICNKYSITLPVPFHNFRDARTFIIEHGSYGYLSDYLEGIKDNRKVYAQLPKMPDDDTDTHNAVYDARRTSWNLWTVLRGLSELQKNFEYLRSQAAQ